MYSEKLISQLAAELKGTGSVILFDEPMSKHTTYRIGGPADLFLKIKTSEQLLQAVKVCRKFDIPYFVLGGGSNILVSDYGIRGVTFHIETETLNISKNLVYIESGFLNAKLARCVAEKGLSGAEFVQAIPGTIGGGIRQNARFRHPSQFGIYSGFISTTDLYFGQLVKSVSILSSGDKVLELNNRECQFSYQGIFKSGFKDSGEIILSVVLELEEDDPEVIRKRMSFYANYRANRSVTIEGQEIAQPLDHFTNSRPKQPHGASAGCVFFNVPNPWDHPTGRMIDMCGLKGKRIGDAQISEKHANYIVNLGHASASDVKALMEIAKAEVLKRFGVDLIPEIEYVGDWSESSNRS